MTTLDFKMFPWQREVLADKKRFHVCVAGRRCGKTRMSVITLIIKALECPTHEGGVLYAAPTLSQARTLVWDLLCDLGRPVITKVNINSSEITLVNGVKIYVRGADSPDSLRGMKLYYAVLDEFKDHKAPTWSLIVRPALADMKGGALIIGTPEAGPSEFRDMYERGQNEDPNNEWRSWLLTTLNNPLIDPAEIEEARQTMSTQAFNVEFMASFQSMEGAIFKEEWIKYAETCNPQSSTFIAVDPAGFEAVQEGKKKHLDNTAIAVVKIDDEGKWFVQKIDYGRWDVRETAVRILMAVRTHRPLAVGIERGSLARALLPYLTDLQRKNNVYCHIEQIPISGNKIDRITYNLQGLFEHGRISLNRREKWDQFLVEYMAFPSAKSHDDLLDSLSLVANLARTTYAKLGDDEEWEPLDEVSGI